MSQPAHRAPATRSFTPEATRIAFLAGVTLSGAFVTARDSLRRTLRGRR